MRPESRRFPDALALKPNRRAEQRRRYQPDNNVYQLPRIRQTGG
jgi:hypothetical protein